MSSEQAKNLWIGYFPIRIYICGEARVMVCNSPANVPQDKQIKVLTWKN